MALIFVRVQLKGPEKKVFLSTHLKVVLDQV